MTYLIRIILVTLFTCAISVGIQAESLSPTLTNGEPAHNYALRIYYDDPAMRRKIIITFEPLESDKSKNYIVVEVGEVEHQRLLDMGLTVEIDASFTELINQPAAAPLPPSAAALAANTIPGFPCYRTVEDTFTSAQAIVSNHPTLASWSDVGDTWEKSNGLGGYDLQVLKLTNSAIPGPKPKAFITSSIHAREYTPAELMTRFAEHLVNNYGVDADITWILNHHEVHLMLQTNPDGRKQAETGILWRKNTNQNYCGATSNSRGADLNRNFAFEWNCCGGSSNDQCSTTYHGSGPASEPETQAVQNYLQSHFVDNRGPGSTDAAPLDTQGLYLDIHSHSELVLWPWGSTSTVAPNGAQLQTLGRKLAFFNNYTPQQSIGLYPTDGTTTSFAYGDLGLPAYTFELGTAFFQDCSTFENTIVPANIPSLIYALKVLRAPYTLPAGPEVFSVDLDHGDLFPVPSGTSITISATADDARYNNSNGAEPEQNIVAAEYYIDIPPWQSGASAIPMIAADGGFDSGSEVIQATVDTTGFANGQHSIFIRSQDANNSWGTVSAIFLTIDDSVGPPTVIFTDDFESDKGWTPNPSNTDTATTGQWQRANPEATNSNGAKQLGDTVSGTQDLVTGATAGASVGVNDIDSGVTSIRSPDISIPAGAPFNLSFSYYMSHTSNSSVDDFFRVSLVGTSTTLLLEEQGSTDDDDASWQSFSTNIDAFAGQTVHFLIEAADNAGGSIVEAGVDDVKIEGICADSDTDGLDDCFELQIGTNPALIDTDGDGVSDYDEVNYDGSLFNYNPYHPVTNLGGTDLNANNPDTDADGYTDLVEITASSNPLDGNNIPIPHDGDLNNDGTVNAADILIATRIITGQIQINATQLAHGDVAPLVAAQPAPDGLFTLGDLVVIQRKALGLISF
ncbi:MAG: M14 family zinc carboxypeptidase [Gammaproteobacteria bacterium]